MALENLRGTLDEAQAVMEECQALSGRKSG